MFKPAINAYQDHAATAKPRTTIIQAAMMQNSQHYYCVVMQRSPFPCHHLDTNKMQTVLHIIIMAALIEEVNQL